MANGEGLFLIRVAGLVYHKLFSSDANNLGPNEQVYKIVFLSLIFLSIVVYCIYRWRRDGYIFKIGKLDFGKPADYKWWFVGLSISLALWVILLLTR